MVRYSVEKRVKIVELYLENNRSVTLTQRGYRRHFNVRDFPAKGTILELVRRFRRQGTVKDLPRGGRPSVRTEENIGFVMESILENSGTSTRKRATQLGMSRSSVRRILKKNLHMIPYKVQMVQELLPHDFQQRLTYALELQQMSREHDGFMHNLIMSDEAHFHLNGFINKQNCRFWGTENPRELHQRQLHPQKCTVWCGVTSRAIIGPYFFENEDGTAASVNGERYRIMLNTFLRPAVERNREMWFQQDGATAHTARATMELLREMFGDRIISRNSAFSWPPRSPDLTAPDFFLWGYLKGKVYVNKPETIQHLKQNIEAEIRELDPDILRKVMESVLGRAQRCEAENGGYLKDVIFHC